MSGDMSNRTMLPSADHFHYADWFLADKTEQQQYELIQRLTSTILSPFQQNMLKFALTLRMYSPTIQMFHQVSQLL